MRGGPRVDGGGAASERVEGFGVGLGIPVLGTRATTREKPEW